MGWIRLEKTIQDLINADGRIHFKLLDYRYVTILMYPTTKKLYAIDSACFHAGGPLGQGIMEDIEDIPTIRCRWHNFNIALDDGSHVKQEIVVQPTRTPKMQMSYPLQPWPKESLGPATRRKGCQRVFPVRVVPLDDEMKASSNGWIEIDIETSYPDEVISDGPSCKEKPGSMCLSISKFKDDEKAHESKNVTE